MFTDQLVFASINSGCSKSISKDHPTPTIRGGPIGVNKRGDRRLSLGVERNAQQGCLKGGPREGDQSSQGVTRKTVTRKPTPPYRPYRTTPHYRSYRTTPPNRPYHTTPFYRLYRTTPHNLPYCTTPHYRPYRTTPSSHLYRTTPANRPYRTTT